MHIVFQHTFEKPIWRIIPSSISLDSWIIELRDNVSKDVTYYFIDQNFILSKIEISVSWWTGVEAVINNFIVFHGFLQEDLPFHKGVKIFGLKERRILWENDLVTFERVLSEQVLETKISIGSIEQNITLSLQTGEEIQSTSNAIETTQLTPIVFSSSQPYFLELSEFIKRYTPYSPLQTIEYIENDRFIFLSYYVENEGKLDNYLLVTNDNGEELLHLCIAESLKAVALGTFYVSDSLFSFVSNKKEFTIVSTH